MYSSDESPLEPSSTRSSMTLLSPSAPRSAAPSNPPNRLAPSAISEKPRPTAGPSSKSRRQTSDLPALVRTTTSTSVHAQNALRRMATHETGGGEGEHPAERPEEEDDDDGGLHTHHEGDDEHEHEHEQTGSAGRGKDEEERIGQPAGSGGSKKKVVELQDQTNLLPTKQVILVFCGLTCALFCSLLDQTIVSTALPTLGRVFGRADISSWVGTAYLLTNAVMQPIYGRLSDIFGRKHILLACLAIFGIGSIMCAVAQTMIQLIVFRAIQGIGGGGILTMVMIIISDVVSLKERGKYQGITGCVVALSNSLGPVLGGVFTDKVTWRWCFYINIPLTAICIVVVIILLPLTRVRGDVKSKLKKLDWIGSALTLAWAALVLIAISWAGNRYAWSSAAVLAPLLIGLALLVVFIIVELKFIALPLIPFNIFRIATVSACYATTFFQGTIFFATLYYLPLYYQVVTGVSAVRSGVLLLPLILTQTVVSFTTGMLQSRTGDYFFNILAGFAIWTIGLGLLSSINESTPQSHLIGFQFLAGVGAGQTFQTSLVAIQAAVKRSEMAAATGTRNFIRTIGGTIGLAVCSALINNIVHSRLDNTISSAVILQILDDPTSVSTLGLDASDQSAIISAYAKGVASCFAFMVPCAGLSFFITLFFVKRIPLKRADDEAMKREAKARWEERKARHGHAHGDSHDHDETAAPSEKSRKDSAATHTAELERKPSVLERVEQDAEDAGREMAEAAAGVRMPIEK